MTSTNKQRELKAAIMYLKDHLIKEWRDVARLLGLTEYEINITNYEYHGKTKEKTYKLFVKWMEQRGARATLSDLIHALRGVDRNDLAYALKRGEHLVNSSKCQNTDSHDEKENTKGTNRKKMEADKQPEKRWYVIVCVVGPVLGAYILYSLITSRDVNNKDVSCNMKTSHSYEEDSSIEEALRTSYTMDRRSGDKRDTTKIEELMETDNLENAVRYVKNSVTKEWQEVGRSLGIPHPDIEHIDEQYHKNPKERNYQMLQRWREQYGNQATLETLENALRKAGRQDLADNLHKEIRKEKTR